MSELKLADRIKRIKPSPSTAAADRARQLREEGRDIVNLTVGEPDFDTPDSVKKDACDAIMRGETKYTAVPGILPLRKAIADRLKKTTGVDYGMNQITVSNGGKQVIFNTLMATVGKGDEVIIPAPFWVSYPDMVLACGGTPVIVPCGEETGFKLTTEALEAAITPNSRWLILNSPSNPTGAIYSAKEMKVVTDVLMRHPQVWLLTDDIYDEIVFTGEKVVSPVAVEPGLIDRTFLINGVSKTYAMTGWRIGYGAGPVALVTAINTLQSQMASCASSVSQAAAVSALTGDQGFVAEWLEVYKKRSELATSLLNKAPGLTCRASEGSFYVYPGCEGVLGKKTPDGKVIETDADFVLYILETEGVAVIAGNAYGLSPYFRISVATSEDIIADGCKRIIRACEALS
ncbi:aspartate transaminase [Cohaesibacter celericrescens]|uniref:Aminotransferase n=1 Tax=Cohaesibacter celericrescens TaxID=2067669 RepID=A0A2N5XVR1_9HYPH|nr:aspartate transaminase [Cohaesibacter celericrescens]PLW78589.1 aspartate aminotransferase [Cohaesibacter celericrescens]